VAVLGGLHTYFLQKGIEQKVNFMEQSQDSKKIAPILFLYDVKSLVLSNLNSKLQFHCAHPNISSTKEEKQ
jgi:hypothetical protein